MSPKISLQELYQYNKTKEKSKILCYERVLELCHRRLRTVAQYAGMQTFFEVPGILVGYPLYNLERCTEHVITSLRKSGFLVQLLPPPHIGVIFISWDPIDLKSSPKAGMGSLSGNLSGSLSGPTNKRQIHAPVPMNFPSFPTNVESVLPNGLVVPKRRIL